MFGTDRSWYASVCLFRECPIATGSRRSPMNCARAVPLLWNDGKRRSTARVIGAVAGIYFNL
jgi:hypothetical protein